MSCARWSYRSERSAGDGGAGKTIETVWYFIRLQIFSLPLDWSDLARSRLWRCALCLRDARVGLARYFGVGSRLTVAAKAAGASHPPHLAWPARLSCAVAG